MAGIIHHGGSGTTHNAARSGQPQAIIPQMLDQYFWGKRIFDLGIGPKPVPQTSLTKRKLVKILRELSHPYHRRQAREVSSLMRLDGIRSIADKIEEGITKT
jgi:sterol 3beta-glucosyltransferase